MNAVDMVVVCALRQGCHLMPWDAANPPRVPAALLTRDRQEPPLTPEETSQCSTTT